MKHARKEWDRAWATDRWAHICWSASRPLPVWEGVKAILRRVQESPGPNNGASYGWPSRAVRAVRPCWPDPFSAASGPARKGRDPTPRYDTSVMCARCCSNSQQQQALPAGRRRRPPARLPAPPNGIRPIQRASACYYSYASMLVAVLGRKEYETGARAGRGPVRAGLVLMR
jgi:hypothetical protein